MLRNWYIRENIKYVSMLFIVALFYSMFFPFFVQVNTATATDQLKRDTGKGAWGFQGNPQKRAANATKKQRTSAAPHAGAGHFLGFTANPAKRTVKVIKKRRTSSSKSATKTAYSSNVSAIENLCMPSDRARMLVPCTEDAESRCGEDTELWMANYAYAFQDNNYLEIRTSYKNVTNDETFHLPLCFTVNEETTLGQIESITLPSPESISDAFGADGILYPGETTTVLTFRIKYKGRAFSFFVDANAVVEEIPTPSPTVSISALPESIVKGEKSTLTWNSTSATSAEIDQGIGSVAVNGSLAVTPTQTTTYAITVMGNGGTASSSVTVRVTDVSDLDQDGDGYTSKEGDCDDTDASVNPGVIEIPYNGKNDDCDNSTPDDDVDFDGYPIAEDCDDRDPNVNPGATETIDNGIDDDCNPKTTDSSLDIDNDGDGYTENQGDCNDENASVNPGAIEIIGNKIDDNCNDTIDEDIVAPSIKITSPKTFTTVGSSPITVTGTVDDPDAIVTVNGAQVTVENDAFTARGITLKEGGNTITATAIDSSNNVSFAHVTIYLDSTPPIVVINSPDDGYISTSKTVSVTGTIYDIVKGAVNEENATVEVNGVKASVSNKTFMVADLMLAEGENTITAVAADQTGNTANTNITVHVNLSSQKKMNLVSGNNQSAPINTRLSKPLVVSLTKEDGSPAVGETVFFDVAENNGTLDSGVGTGQVIAFKAAKKGVVSKESREAARSLAMTTDANGQASVYFTTGSRSGAGNNEVKATAVGYTGEVVFMASALQGIPSKINIGTGNNQRGATNTALPNPLVAIVTDVGHNVIRDVPVTFTVESGGGHIGGEKSVTVATDSDGMATVTFTLGYEEGYDNHSVSANFEGNPHAAMFRASGFTAGDPGETSIRGVVLDNSNIPIKGVTMRVDGTTREAVTDEEGQFLIKNVPVGPLHLVADGSTVESIYEYPVLAFEINTISGQENSLGMPIYLLPLNTKNAQWVGGYDVEYVLEDVPGFSLTIKGNSVTFPDGSHEGAISVTQVHADKVPMEPPNGLQARFIITIQPPGAVFDPPAPIALPNVDGLAPGEITEMYSFDHDLGQFVSIGLGTVSEDGTVLKSNPGVGIIKAGWHCGSPPQGYGCAHECPQCQDCNSLCDCVIADNDPRIGECEECRNGVKTNKPDDTCCGGGTSICKNGNCESVELTSVEAKVNGKDEEIVLLETNDTTVNFTGSATGSNCEYEYDWDFGDGGSSTDQNPNHTYTNPGEYDVKITVNCKKCSTAEKTETVKVTILKIDIERDGKIITDETTDVSVGNHIYLSGVVQPEGLEIDSKVWTIPGNRVKYYDASRDHGKKFDLEHEDLNNTPVSFYWVDGGDGREVIYTVTIDDKTFDVKSIFNVKRPDAKIITETSSININYYDPKDGNTVDGNILEGTFLQFGKYDSISKVLTPGIKFSYEIKSDFQGEIQWVQLIRGHIASKTDWTGTTTSYKEVYEKPFLDNVYPYSLRDSTADSPSGRLNNLEAKAYSCGGTFKMWLMYKPSGDINAIVVPLRLVDWYWGALTSFDLIKLKWEILDKEFSIDPQDEDTKVYPEWPDVFENIFPTPKPSPTPTAIPSPSPAPTPPPTPTQVPSPTPSSTPIIIIVPPPTVTFSADPETIIEGESTQLGWNSTDATSAEIDQGIGEVEVNGTISIIPATTTTYTITATGIGGTSDDSVTVTVTNR